MLALVALCASACGLDDDASTWLDDVEEAHAMLDRAEGRAARLEAMDTLAVLVEADPPAEIAAGDARSVRQDAFYVLASTALTDGDPYAARRFATVGLSLGMRKDVLVTNLLVARGEAFEALGDPQHAASDYHRALTIASDMLDARLGAVGGSRP